MADLPTETVERKRPGLEFWLVFSMLVALVVLVGAVLFWPIDIPGYPTPPDGKETTLKDVLDYRAQILSIIITAFGAWVGAGAAYFFGRENLRVAADSLLAMRDISPRERLRKTSIKQLPPASIDWTVKKTTPLDEVKAKLTQNPDRWFIPVVTDEGKLDTVLNEEAFWRFWTQESLASPLASPTVADVLDFIKTNEGLLRFRDRYVEVPLDTTVGAATEMMDNKHVFLAIVVLDGKPTYFFTTSEVRKLLLSTPAVN